MSSQPVLNKHQFTQKVTNISFNPISWCRRMNEILPPSSPHKQLRSEPLSFRRLQWDQSICRSQALKNPFIQLQLKKKNTQAYAKPLDVVNRNIQTSTAWTYKWGKTCMTWQKYDYTVAVTAEIKSFKLYWMTKMVTEMQQYLI